MKFNITLRKKVGKEINYMNPFNCPIAKALRRKGVFISTVAFSEWIGLWLGIIPVWGKVPKETDAAAHLLSTCEGRPQTYGLCHMKIGLYNKGVGADAIIIAFIPLAIELIILVAVLL